MNGERTQEDTQRESLCFRQLPRRHLSHTPVYSPFSVCLDARVTFGDTIDFPDFREETPASGPGGF